MNESKRRKLDFIFWIGIIIISIIGGILDCIYWWDVTDGGFPIFCCYSVMAAYTYWIGLLIYSYTKYPNSEIKPKYKDPALFIILFFITLLISIASMVATRTILTSLISLIQTLL